MGWFDFLKSKDNETQNTPVRTIPYSEVSSLLAREAASIGVRLERVKKEIQSILSETIRTVHLQLDEVNKIDITARKEPERVKIIVRENIAFYRAHVEKLCMELESITPSSAPDEYVRTIETRFNAFKQNSFKNFEKATILVGRELERVDRTMKDFLKTVRLIVDANKNDFMRLEEIRRCNDLLVQRTALHLQHDAVLEEVHVQNTLVHETERGAHLTEQTYNSFMKSEEYTEYLAALGARERNLSALSVEATALKEKMHLKEVIKKVHGSVEKRALLQSYRDHFFDTLVDDVALQICDILNAYEGIDIRNDLVALRNKIVVYRAVSFIEIEEKRKKLTQQNQSMLDNLERARATLENAKKKEERISLQLKELDVAFGEKVHVLFPDVKV